MPSRFTGELKFTSIDSDCIVWRTEQNLIYEIGSLGSGKFVIVPEKFETDGASIPKILRGMLPSFGRYTRAAIVHDYLCDRYWNKNPHPDAQSLEQVDEIFYEAMTVLQVNSALAWTMYKAVRLGRLLPFLNDLGSKRS